MDLGYIYDIVKRDIKKECPQLPIEIIDEFLDLTFFRANWVTFCNKYSMYIIGIVETEDDFYYIGFNDNYDDDIILTASCALEFKKDKERDNDLIIHWGSGNEEKEQEHWRNIRKKLIEYLNENEDYHLIYFQDIALDNEHLVFDNKEHTKYHLEKIEPFEKTFI